MFYIESLHIADLRASGRVHSKLIILDFGTLIENIQSELDVEVHLGRLLKSPLKNHLVFPTRPTHAP